VSSESFQNYRQEFYTALIECIGQLTEIPIGLYENNEGHVEAIIPEISRAIYEKHCKLIQSFPGGRQRCEADQLKRAKAALRSEESVVRECCWAGVFNESVPIRIDSSPIALLVYGEVQLDGHDHQAQSLDKHRQAVATLGLNVEQADQLREGLLSVKRYEQKDFAKLKDLLSKAERLIHVFKQEENKAKYAIEKNTHELNTRLQSVIAHAENLVSQIKNSDFQEAKQTAKQVLNSAESLDTVVQGLGDYLEQYRFKRQPLGPLIHHAVSLYEAEAKRRGVDILTHLDGDEIPINAVDISARHLQYAINNLIHNAVKYSFRGGAHRYRFVEIAGQPEKNFYCINITNYGVGILPEERERVFQDGYQGQLTRGEYRTGSGKGLWFVKRTIEHHHGRIEVESLLRAEKETPEGKPHLNKFTLRLPYNQPRGGR
jgi:signal transduction histidine kinase